MFFSGSGYKAVKRNSQAFTLTEVIVVVSIISVLAALSLPLLSGVMTKQKIAISLSNLSQLGKVTILYANDHEGDFPLVNDNSTSTQIGWTRALWPYAYGDRPFPGYGIYQKNTIFYTPLLEPSLSSRSYGPNKIIESRLNNRKYLLIQNISQTALIGDVRDLSALDQTQINYRNNGKANILYVDGHVNSLSPEEVPSPSGNVFWSGSYSWTQ